MPLPNFPVGLTREELREIGLRRDGRDVIRLLWEIKRLRALVLRADQVTRTSTSASWFLVDVFRKELEGEPVIEEMESRVVTAAPTPRREE